MTYDDSKNRVNFWVKACFAALGSVLGAARLSAGSASAGSAVTHTVLYSFCQQTNCADGSAPNAGLIATPQGGLYGTTEFGGGGGFGNGVAFLVTVNGGIGLLHAFQGGAMDGAFPEAPLFRDKSGNFFGTTSLGGGTGCFGSGCGTVFERSASGVYRLRHAFTGADGSIPLAGVIADSAGNLYGTTSALSLFITGSGTIFRLTPSGILTTLYSFCSVTGCTDGQNPDAGLIGDANGNLYGTTKFGGANGSGVVFKIHADGTNYTVLHSFGIGTDGANPEAGLSADPSGNLYGTTINGGANGDGTVFKIEPDGSNYAVLYNFCSLSNCADGSEPAGGLILDADGNLYGTALYGGANNNNKGVVFALSPSGTETVLYSFCNQVSNEVCTDGAGPVGNLVALGNGNLYGTTQFGGTMDGGTVYQLTNTGFVVPTSAAAQR